MIEIFALNPFIYAMLLGLHDFYFLFYNGINFQCMAQILIVQCPHMDFMKGMMQGMYSKLSQVASFHANSQQLKC